MLFQEACPLCPLACRKERKWSEFYKIPIFFLNLLDVFAELNNKKSRINIFPINK